MDRRRVREIDERPPTRTFWFFKQSHVGFVRKTIAFPGVAGDAGTHDVFPTRFSTALTWQDVVEVEVFAIKLTRTILTRVMIAFVDVLPRKFDLLARQAIEEQKDNDCRNSNVEAHRMYHFLAR